MGRHMNRTPIWKSIADTVSSEIAACQYRPGDKLPTEAQFSQRFGVNRHTVRHALASLVELGIVHTRRGAGAFVAQKPTEYPIGPRTRFSQNVLAAGQTPTRDVLSVETRLANARECEALMLEEGAMVHVSEALSYADGQPIALSRTVFPAAPYPDLPELMKRFETLTAALRAAGVTDYTRAWTRLTAKQANATQALHLRIREGDPILRSDSLNRDAHGRPLELGRTWFAGDRVTLTLAADAASLS